MTRTLVLAVLIGATGCGKNTKAGGDEQDVGVAEAKAVKPTTDQGKPKADAPAKKKTPTEAARAADVYTSLPEFLTAYVRNSSATEEEYAGRAVVLSHCYVQSRSKLADGRVMIRCRPSPAFRTELVVYVDTEDAAEVPEHPNCVVVVGTMGPSKGGSPTLRSARVVFDGDGVKGHKLMQEFRDKPKG